MTYLSGNVKKRKSYVTYFLYGCIFLVVVTFWPELRTRIYTVIEPAVVRIGITKGSLSIFPDFFRIYTTSHATFIAQQKELEAKIEDLENLVAEQDSKLREESLISSIQGTTSSIRVSPIILYPLMQDITKMYSTILLSKGYKDGITIGSTVYIRGNQAVCTIKEVFAASSLCLLLTSAGVITEGVTSSSSITLSLVGRGGHFIANVLRDTPISVGEIVYVRNNPNTTIGVVKEIVHNNQDTSWRVFVEGAYNPVTSSIFYVQQ